VTIESHAESFASLPIRDYEPGAPLRQPSSTLYRLRLSWDDYEGGLTIAGLLDQFLDEPEAAEVPGLVIGAFSFEGESSAPVVEALVAARERLPRLRVLFLGDITREEQEISWIEQSDISPLLAAYPGLEHFGVRGGNSLSFGEALRHERLRSLVVEAGGLGREAVRQIASAELPELEHLELWLGTDEYGGDATVTDLEPILSGERFPCLRYLGLRNSQIADAVAGAAARARILERIETLDLSLGTLGDEGARHLLESPLVQRLERLDVHHHFMTPEVMEQLEALPILRVDVSQKQEPDRYGGEEWRHTAVAE
jgi:hypothetical protein